MSIQPRKQRKRVLDAPLHRRQKMVSVHLSKELRKKLSTKKRSIPVKKGDRVALMLPNIPQMVIAYYGTLRAGAVGVAKTALSPDGKLAIHGENMQSHILHIGYLVAPDLLGVGSVFPLLDQTH
jgi:acyl-coenzyme A synthetase/AMP-(fatty) acid ligase